MKLLPTRCFLDGTAWQIISDSTFMLSLMLQSQFIVSTIWSPASQLPLRAYIKKNTADKMNSATQNSVWQPQTTTEAPPGFQDCTGSCSAPVETGGKLTCFIWHKLPFLILYKILLLFVCVWPFAGESHNFQMYRFSFVTSFVHWSSFFSGPNNIWSPTLWESSGNC